LQFPDDQNASTLGIRGEETFEITGVTAFNDGRMPETVHVKAGDVEFDALVRIDTPTEAEYFRHGGILQYAIRNLLN
jgi:aconitate hydratase